MADEEPERKNIDPKLSRLFDKIRAGNAKVQRKKLERQGINDDIASVRADLESEGIHKEAFDLALKYAGWDSNKRRGFDRAYAIVREALDMPVEGDLFSYRDGNLPQKPPKEPGKTSKLPATPGTSAAVAAAAETKRKAEAKPKNKPPVKPMTTTERLAAASKASQETISKTQEQLEQEQGAELLKGIGINSEPVDKPTP